MGSLSATESLTLGAGPTVGQLVLQLNSGFQYRELVKQRAYFTAMTSRFNCYAMRPRIDHGLVLLAGFCEAI